MYVYKDSSFQKCQSPCFYTSETWRFLGNPELTIHYKFAMFYREVTPRYNSSPSFSVQVLTKPEFYIKTKNMVSRMAVSTKHEVYTKAKDMVSSLAVLTKHEVYIKTKDMASCMAFFTKPEV